MIFIIFVIMTYLCQELIYEDCQTFRYLLDADILIWHLFEYLIYTFRTFIIISVYIHLALGILRTYIQFKALFTLKEIIVVWDIQSNILVKFYWTTYFVSFDNLNVNNGRENGLKLFIDYNKELESKSTHIPKPKMTINNNSEKMPMFNPSYKSKSPTLKRSSISEMLNFMNQ